METDNSEYPPLDNMYGLSHTQTETPYRVLKTTEFVEWLDRLPIKTRSIVLSRLDLMAVGHFGNCKRFEGLIELRWKSGTRVYAFFWGTNIVVASYGGNKHGQDRDIKKTKKIRDQVLDGTRTLLQS